MNSAFAPLSDNAPTRPLVIAGLRRSGTTALWEALRQHSELVAFDEPFHPRLWQGARESTKGTWRELTALWRSSPSEYVPGAEAIAPLDELDRIANKGQVEYFSALLAHNGGQVVVDIVRTWNKLPQLVSVCPQPYVVQLVRSPVPWVLSHLIPSGRGSWRKPIGDVLRRFSALKRNRHFNNWQYETIIDAMLVTDHPAWRQVAISPKCLAASPAYIKLLAFWWAANRTMAQDLANVVPEQHRILLAEDFMASPSETLRQLLAASGLPHKSLDTSFVRPARKDQLQNERAFAEAFSYLGIPSSLLPTPSLTSQTLMTALYAGRER
jgi:hypothetical protein